MADIDFSDLIPEPKPQIDFSDLIPKASAKHSPQSATDLAFGGEDPSPDVTAQDRPLGRLGGLPAAINAGMRGAADAMTFGQADRMAASLGAATGVGGTFGDYAGNLDRQHAATKAADESHPVASTLGKASGAVAGAAGLMKSGVTLVPSISEAIPGLTGRALGIGADGAALGAMDGAGHAESLASVPEQAIKGAGEGASVGFALPVVGSGLAAAYRATAPVVGKAVDGVSRGASQMLSTATGRHVAEELDRLGPNAMLADAGPALQGLAEGVAMKRGEGQDALVRALRDRDEGRGERLAAAVSDNLGTAVSPAARTAELRAQRRAETGPLFAQAFSEAPPVDVLPVVAEIGQALRKARGPERAALQRAVAMLGEPGAGGARGWTSDAETIHNVKTALDQLVRYGDPALGVAPGALSKEQGVLKRIRGGLNDSLRSQVPGYGAATDASAAFAREIEAIEEGAAVLDGGKAAIWPADLNARLARMTPNERAGLFVGVRGSIENRVGTEANDLDALKKALGGEQGWNRQKMSSVFGETPTREVSDTIDRESRFARTFSDVERGARGAPRRAAAEMIDRAGLPDVPTNLTAIGTGARVAQTVGKAALKAITGARSGAIRDELGDILSRTGSDRDRIFQAILDAMERRDGRAAAIRGAVGNSATAAGARELLAAPMPFGFSGR